DCGAVDLIVLVENLLAEALEQRAAHLRVVAQQMVDDLVTGDRRGAVSCERREGLALPRSDPARDGDGDRSRQRYSRSAGGSGSAGDSGSAGGSGSVGASTPADASASGASGAGSASAAPPSGSGAICSASGATS